MTDVTNLFSHKELTDILEIIHDTVSCKDVNQLEGIVKRLNHFSYCDHVIFGMSRSKDQDGPADEFNISYPQEWVEMYQENEYWRIDPVFQATMTSHSQDAFYWDDIYKSCQPKKKFINLSRDFGLKEGYSCVGRSVSGDWSMISVAGNKIKKDRRLAYILERLHPHFHNILVSLNARKSKAKISGITKREAEILKWLEQGKTSWEISLILKISESTVNFHVQNIKTKLDVVNRGQAVAIAIYGGLI